MFGQNSWSNPFGNDNFLPFLKVQFFGLKMTVFYSKYRTTIFSDIISVKKTAIRESLIFGQNPWTNPLKNVHF